MKTYAFLILGVQCLVLVQSNLLPIGMGDPLKGTPARPGSIWPPPFIHYRNTDFFAFDTANFDVFVWEWEREVLVECPQLDWAIDHYKNLIRSLKPENASDAIGISVLRIEMAGCAQDTDIDSVFDELVQIKVEKGSNGIPVAILQVNGFWGAVRGLESFYQMLWPADDTYTVYNINSTEVIDWPRFTHRGVMIDTARHYLPEETILRVLDGMMYSKFNLLHWHIVDDQSFPYVSQKFPELSEKGAYHKKAVYTPETIQRIQEAALHRGIRVMLEFDTPGHTGGFGKSHPEFLTPCHGESKDGSSINIADRINFDPSNEEMYTFMREFFTEVVQNVTNNKLLHIGMDEVYGDCWESSPKIQEFMRQNNYTDWRQVQGHYTKKHVEMIKSLGVTPVAWQDPMDDGVELDKDVIIHIWKFYEWLPWPETLSKALKLGHKVIFSACWYINLINYGQSWREYYECDPVEGADTEGYEDQILGGEAAIWGEFVDQTNIEARLFPYASAVAGVLWTDRDGLPDTDNAMWALHDFRCKLLRRGIRAQPLLCGYCGPFEVDLDM